VDRIIVTRPVLQADEDLGFLPGDIAEKFAPYFRPVYDVLVLGFLYAAYRKSARWKSRRSPICADVHLKMPW
jgi:predicted ribonuclease YlaK